MKRLLLLIVAFAVLSVVVSCSDDDDPKRGDGVFTVNTLMINHMYNTNTNEVIGLDKAYNKLVLDTVLDHGDLGEHTVRIELSDTHEGDVLPFYLVSVITSGRD